MQTNEYFKHNGCIYRLLDKEKALVINCTKKSMPEKLCTGSELCTDSPEPYSEPEKLCTDTGGLCMGDWEPCTESELYSTGICTQRTLETLSPENCRVMHHRYAIIAPILPYISDSSLRSFFISSTAESAGISKQTVRKYLCLFLTSGQMEILAPSSPAVSVKSELSEDEKNFRWALNKYYYTQHKNKLTVAYTMMLRAKYTDSSGKLTADYPPFHRFSYYYRKTKNERKSSISRDGLKAYERNKRPLLGTISDFAPAVGVGMLDSTICDIYLVNSAGQLVGRPMLTLCVDAFSGLCCGYNLTWEGGVFSLQGLLQNVISDKKNWCKRFGMSIENESWPCHSLPATLVTDKGREYCGNTFEQITELGVQLVNLPPYRPELKGPVESAFHAIQDRFKPVLRGKGVIEPDFQERGAHDYRKDACLTMTDFEKVILSCIVFFNSSRILENPRYTLPMLETGIQPYPNEIWSWGIRQPGAHLIETDSNTLKMTLLPRTEGRFTRKGLVVNGQRYRNQEGDYTERYLKGGKAIVAYSVDNLSSVWLFENAKYAEFVLILKQYDGLSLQQIADMQNRESAIKKDALSKTTQASVDLIDSIQAIARNRSGGNTEIRNIRQTHHAEKAKRRMERHDE